MGRNRDSINDKKLRGTFRKDRDVAVENSGKEITSIKWCLSVSGYRELSMRAKAIYRSKCHEMMEGPGLFKSQLQQLIIYANTWDTYWQADKEVKKDGILIKYYDTNMNERKATNPALLIREEASKQLRQISKDFGIQPIDRQKLKIVATSEEDPLEEFMEQFS